MAKYKIIKDCDGNLLYKRIIEDPLDIYREQKEKTRKESLVGKWIGSGLRHISRRVDRNYSLWSKYRTEYKCVHCNYKSYTRDDVKNHLIHSHRKDVGIGDKSCHACRKKYNVLYKAKKYAGWDEYKRRKHHWETCLKVEERIKSYIPSESQAWTSRVFDTTSLPLNIRHNIFNCFEKKYISYKHIYSECQPKYIDNITTAYQSDIMKEILYQQ